MAKEEKQWTQYLLYFNIYKEQAIRPLSSTLWKYVIDLLKTDRTAPVTGAILKKVQESIDAVPVNLSTTGYQSFFIPQGTTEFWKPEIKKIANKLQNLVADDVQSDSKLKYHYDAAPFYNSYRNNQQLTDSNNNSLAALIAQAVIPMVNTTNQNYLKARGHDIVKKDLVPLKAGTTENILINDTQNSYVRLLMPLYGQLTKIEDLNRNFWVISQAISTITKEVLNDTVKDIYKGLIGEIVTLWENIYYLWLNNAILAQEKDNGVRVLVVPITNNGPELYPFINKNLKDENWDVGKEYDLESRHDIINEGMRNLAKVVSCENNQWKVDLFGYIPKNGRVSGQGTKYIKDYQDGTKDVYNDNVLHLKRKIFQKIKHYADLYPNNHLCIIPYFRVENYESNYYTGEYYKYIFMLNRNIIGDKGHERSGHNYSDWAIYTLKTTISEKQSMGCLISPKYDCRQNHVNSRLQAVSYGPGMAVYFKSFNEVNKSRLSNVVLDEPKAYAALRTEVIPKFVMDGQKALLSELNIYTYDAVAESRYSIRNSDNQNLSYSEIYKETLLDEYKGTLDKANYVINFTISENYSQRANNSKTILVPEQKIRSSIYLGECPSCQTNVKI